MKTHEIRLLQWQKRFGKEKVLASMFGDKWKRSAKRKINRQKTES